MATTGANEIPFLGEWSQLRRERSELRDRLAKLEHEQGRFSDSVLARVRVDYERRIHDLELRSTDLADRANREVASLTVAVDQQEAEARACRLGLEEFELRETLGETLDEESARRAAAGRAELARLEDDLRAMRELLERVRAIAEGRTGSSSQVLRPAFTLPVATPAGREPSAHPSGQAAVHRLPPPLPFPAPQAVPVQLPPLPPLTGALPVQPALQIPSTPPLPPTIISPPLPPTIISPPRPAARTTPASVAAVPRLVPIESADSSDHFALRPKTTVGRTAECDLRLPVGTVSRRHAEVEWTEEGWRIRDLQSENGTWVNSERAFDRLLVDGDRIQFGTVCLVFKLS